MPARVLLVDDVVQVRETLREALQLRGGFEVVGEVGDAPTALQLAAFEQPDVVVLDLGLESVSDGDMIAALRAASPRSIVVVFTAAEGLAESLRSSVGGVVAKREPIGAVLDVITHALADTTAVGEVHLPPEVASVRRARSFMAEVCGRLTCPHEVADLAAVVASELVSNAVVHAATWSTLSVRRLDGALRIEVLDRGAGSPNPRWATATDENGRGLQLVSSFCTAWGVESPFDRVKIVWAELPWTNAPSLEPVV